MSKVTRIAYSQKLNPGKLDQLREIASRLGNLRAEVWHRYGSIAGVFLTSIKIRDEWLAEEREFDVPARLWKETLRDTFDDICLYREAAKVRVRKAIFLLIPDENERKRLVTLLKYDRWTEDKYLRRMMRKHFKHGKTKVDNQIILDTGCYTAFSPREISNNISNAQTLHPISRGEHKGQAWIKVMSLERGKRTAIPLDTNRLPYGTLRLILRNSKVEVHYAVNADTVCSQSPCGGKKVGIDKGYSEAFVDSDGQVHGSGLGDLLSAYSDVLKVKYQRRNKLRAIAEAKPHVERVAGAVARLPKQLPKQSTLPRLKAQAIFENNLGRKKLDKRKCKHRTNVRDKVFKAVHSVVDKARTISCEDLATKIASKKQYGKNQKRRLSGWVKGLMQEALNQVSQRRGSSLVLVNCAY